MGERNSRGFLRELGENVHEPCDSLPIEYQPSCHYEQVQWWWGVMDSDWQTISLMCEDLKDNQANFTACYNSIGHHIAFYSQYDIDAVKQTCDTMLTPGSVGLCAEGASWVIIGRPNRVSDAYSLCGRLEAPYNKRCESKLDQTPNGLQKQ